MVGMRRHNAQLRHQRIFRLIQITLGESSLDVDAIHHLIDIPFQIFVAIENPLE